MTARAGQGTGAGAGAFTGNATTLNPNLIVFDAKSSAVTSLTGTSLSGVTAPLWTTGTGSNFVGLVMILWGGDPGTVGTATLNGGIGNTSYQNTARNTTSNVTVGFFCWTGLAASTGYTPTLSWTNSVDFYVFGCSFDNANQTGGTTSFANFNSATGNSATAAVNITENNAANDAVVAIGGTASGGAGTSDMSPGTLLFTIGSGQPNMTAGYTIAVASPVTMTFATVGDNYVIAGLNITAFSGGAVNWNGAASFSGAGAFTANAQVIRAAQGAFAGAGAFTANATFSYATGFATFTGAGGFAANAQLIDAARASFAGAGGFTASAQLIKAARASFAGVGNLAANGAPPTHLVSSYTAGSERDNFNGQVGMVFTPTANLTVLQMGLRFATGDTGVHTINLYAWAGGNPIGSLLRSATVDLTGGTIGTFYYGDITPITLSSDTAYALVTPVANVDGQFWADEGPTTLNNAVNIYAVFTLDSITFSSGVLDQQFWGLDLNYTPSASTHLLSSFATASERDDFNGQVGMIFTPTANLTFNQVGLRQGSGDTGVHTINLYDWAGGNPIGSLLRSGTVDMTGGVQGQFYYGSISQITLTSGSTYALVTPVTFSDGQFWSDQGPTTLYNASSQSVFTVDSVTFTTDVASSQFWGLDLNLTSGTNWQGAAAFAGAGSFTANAAQPQRTASATFAGAGAFTANAQLLDTSAAAFAGTGAFTANAQLIEAAQATFAGASAFTATGLPVDFGFATFAGAGAFTGNAQLIERSQATFSGAGNFAANATFSFATGFATLSGAGSFTANAPLFDAAQATFAGAGAFTANGTIQGGATNWQGAATFAGAGAFTSVASEILAAQGTFAGAGGFTPNATARLAAQATFAGAGSFAANATFSYATGFATLAGAGGFTANAGPGVLAAASTFAGAGAFTANAKLVETAQASFVGTGAFTVIATAQFSARTTFAGVGAFAANATIQVAGKQGAANFAGVGAFTATAAQPQRAAAANFNGAGGFTANATVRMATQAAFAGAGSFTANVNLRIRATATFVGAGSFVTDGVVPQRILASAAFTGTGSLTADPTIQTAVTWTGAASFAGTGAFIADARTRAALLPVPSGRWSPVFDTNYPHSGNVSPPTHFLDIRLSEVGFTLYFITPTATNLPPNAALVFTRPDGSSFRIAANRFYTGQNSPVIRIDPLNGAYAAYVTNADINQRGTWIVEIRDAANNNISGAGYFSVAA